MRAEKEDEVWNSGNRQLTGLWLSDPKAALAAVESAIKEAGGNVTAAAKKLKLNKRTLYRWLYRHPEVLDAARSAE